MTINLRYLISTYTVHTVLMNMYGLDVTLEAVAYSDL